MKLEKFNYSSGKRGRWFLYGVICTVLLMILINLFLSQAKYLKTESIKLVEGSISYKPYDFKIMAMYQENDNGEYEEKETMPASGYKINEEKSYCTLDNVNIDTHVVLKTIDGNHTISNLSKNSKCYVWFDKISTIQDIVDAHVLTIRTDFSTALIADTTGTMFMTEDDYGISYYYAGAVQDNWVKFGGFYWRIIRINGDGTLRLIYSGSEESGPVTTGEGTQIGISTFNENAYENAYVGYMYTNGEVHGTSTNSAIKGLIDTWYNNNIGSNTSYTSKIATGGAAVFCNDRQPSNSSTILNGLGGTETTETWYAPFIRLYPSYSNLNANPSLKCVDENDRFTTQVGLITADEVSYAGGVYDNSNQNYYLFTNQNYWTMSPSGYPVGDSLYPDADVLLVYSSGCLYSWGLNSIWGIRPVINLKADTQFSSGNGTTTSPYIVS